jgi:hypothetical protein
VVCTAVDMASGRYCVHIVHCCSLVQKPVSSVAPTSVQHQKPSPIYQTSSTKIHPVQPQTLSSTPQVKEVLAVLIDRMRGNEWRPFIKWRWGSLFSKSQKMSAFDKNWVVIMWHWWTVRCCEEEQNLPNIQTCH